MARTSVPHRGCLIFLVVLLVGCSGTSRATTTGAPPSADLVVTMSEWRFAPQNGRIAAGAPAILELRNTGTVPHDWTLVDGLVESESDLGDVEIVASLEVNPGGVSQIQVPALEPGVYDVVCAIPGHIANGMLGTLTISG